jgi:thiol-disulfide isomerase/thioredoxin
MRTILSLVFVVAILGGCDRQNASAPQGDDGSRTAEAPAKARPAGGVDRSHAGTPLIDVGVRDPDGDTVPLMSVRKGGKPLLVNLWATWCAPCIKELPTLDALADRPGAPQVVALSQDSGDQGKVSAFLTQRKLGLEPFQDPEMEAMSALGAQVLPTTVLYGSDGKEVWRYSGDLDWTGPEAAKLLAEAA